VCEVFVSDGSVDVGRVVPCLPAGYPVGSTQDPIRRKPRCTRSAKLSSVDAGKDVTVALTTGSGASATTV